MITTPLDPAVLYDWIQSLKQRLAIVDDYENDTLAEYIAIAHRNIWTQYYQLALENDIVPSDHPWAYDFVTKQGTLHLAALYFSNPTTTTETNNTVIDQRMLYKILGSRVNYG
ncbi:hypothetical protein [Mycoplasma sp. VS410B]|uniref:hypothetical protein n=1 Tax=Mycoplasma sp. VS410B TaxID=3401688 RepID=UPI003AAF8752